MKKEDYAAALDVIREEAEPRLDVRTAQDLLRSVRSIASRLDRIAARQCNGYPIVAPNGRMEYGWDKEAAARDERAEEKLDARLAALGAAHGLTFTTQGDPRGYVVKLKTPKTKRYNTMGGAEEGWGIA